MCDSEYGQPGTIDLYRPVYDQPGINLSLLWQSIINLFVWWGNPSPQIFL